MPVGCNEDVRSSSSCSEKQRGGKGCTLNSCFRTISLVVGRTSRLGQKAVVVVQMEVPEDLG